MNSTQRDSHGLFSKKNVQAYSLFLQTGRIPQKSIKWYLTWIRQFENSINGKLFSQIAAEDVKAFLSHLSCNDNIQQWQVDQARDSLRLFFRDFLNVPWARAANRTTAAQSDSNIRSQSHMHSDNWTPPHGSDTTAAASLPQLSHQDLLEKLRTEIRVRHYSIRTEQSYEQWVNRFFKYLNNKPVPEVTPDPHCAGIARTCRCLDNNDLYACAEQAGACGEESGGLKSGQGKTYGKSLDSGSLSGMTQRVESTLLKGGSQASPLFIVIQVP